MTDTAKPKPLPCPFCGGDDLTFYIMSEDCDIAAIFCRTCKAVGPEIDIDPEDSDDELVENIYGPDAISAWNKRTETNLTPCQLLERVRELEGAMNRILCQSHADECCGEYKLNHDGIPDCCGASAT